MLAIVLPFTMLMVPFVWIVPFLGLVWFARSFTLRDKIAATAVILVPMAALAGWALLAADGVDDISAPVLLVVLTMQAIVWLRLVYVALRPPATELVPLETSALTHLSD